MFAFIVGLVVTGITMPFVFAQLRKHPRGLFVLFFAEMWERFSYYGMRGLLIFYLTQHFLFSDEFSQGQYAAYTSLVYLVPLIGGVLADRFIGTRKAIAFGALLLVAGHFTMGVEGPEAVQRLTYQGSSYVFDTEGNQEARTVRLRIGEGLYEVGASPDGGMAIKNLPADAPLPSVLAKGSYQLTVEKRDPFYTNILYLALALIIMGVGFLKPNISSIVGQLYTEADPRRDPGFTLYYYGINLGAFWATIACGWLAQEYGWWAGFGAAGVGMLLGFLVFVSGKSWLEGKGEPPDPAKLKRPALGPINLEWSIYLAGLAGVAVIWFVVQRNEIVGYLLAAGSIAVLGYFLVYMVSQGTKVEVQRLLLAIVLILGSVVFWTLFEQAGSSLNQFAERNTDLSVGTLNVTATQVQSVNAGLILLLAPVFSFIWAVLGRRDADPNPLLKFGLALVQVGAGFFVLVWGASFADESFRVPLIFLVLTYLLHTTGELCLSPVGLSQMTKLSPAVTLSTVMATWFLASAAAQYVGGFVAQMTAAETVAGQVLDPERALATYVDVFSLIGMWGIGAGLVFFLLSPLLRSWAHEKHVSTAAPQPVSEVEAARR